MSKDMIKKLLAILDRQQKVRIVGLVVLILIGGILETVGVSLILPLLSAILDEKSFAANEWVILFMDLLGIENVRHFIYLLLFALIFMYIFKAVYLIWLTYVQSKFVNRNRCRCTTNLLSQYLHKPYEYYLYAETSTIVRTIAIVIAPNATWDNPSPIIEYLFKTRVTPNIAQQSDIRPPTIKAYLTKSNCK